MPNVTKEENRVLERAYFHICNSGVTVIIRENIRHYEEPIGSSTKGHSFKMEVQLAAFGTQLVSTINLDTDGFVGWLVEALSRTRKRMQQVSADTFTSMKEGVYVHIRDGEEVDERPESMLFEEGGG